MLKIFLPLMTLMLCCVSCTASATKAEAAQQQQPTLQETTVTSDTSNMTPDSIPAGSKKVEVETTAGNFTLLLYGDTPRHRDNFIKLVNDHVYDGVLFHRVINDFMIQGGDPSSKTAASGKLLGDGDAGEPIDAEIVFPRHFHKRGALAAARQGDAVNPERKSSASQFYIVTGRRFPEDQLVQMDARIRRSVGQNHFNELARTHMDEIRQMQEANDTTGLRQLQTKLTDETNAWMESNPVGMTKEMREAYKTVGGTPHLDNEYTVYGEVISGMDVIDKIQKVVTDANDRPIEDVKIITMKVLDD